MRAGERGLRSRRGPAPGSSPKGEAFGAHLVRDLATLLAVGGALTYGLLALAYDRFYRELGIGPESVGITRASIVGYSASALSILGALGIGFYLGVFTLMAKARPRERTLVVALRALVVAGLLGPLMLAGSIAPVLYSGQVVPWTLAGQLALAVSAAVSVHFLRDRPSESAGREMVSAWLAVGCVLYFVLVASVTVRADELAQRVREGWPIPPSGATFLYSFRADPACLKGSGNAVDAPRYALMLGEANGMTAVYDPTAHRTLRYATSDLTLTLIPSAQWPGTKKHPVLSRLPRLCD